MEFLYKNKTRLIHKNLMFGFFELIFYCKKICSIFLFIKNTQKLHFGLNFPNFFYIFFKLNFSFQIGTIFPPKSVQKNIPKNVLN